MKPPSISYFRSPGFTEPTPHTVHPPDADGWRRTEGHLALWASSHAGYPGQNLRPPRSPSDYSHFHIATTEVAGDDGAAKTISCGHLTCDTGHASLEASAGDAARFYDNTGTLAASVCAGEDQFGIWYSGVVEPELPELTLRRFSSCSQSGDWRSIDGGPLDLVASLSVVTPGFAIPRARVASGALTASAQPITIVAAGALPPRDVDPADIVITLNRSVQAEEATMTDTTDTTTADGSSSEAVTAAAPAPSIGGKPPAAPPAPDTADGGGIGVDAIVMLSGDVPPGVVTEVDGDTAKVEIEVPVAELEAAGEDARKSMVASARERLRDREQAATNKRLDAIAEALKAVPALAASVDAMKAKDEDREDAALLASIPPAGAEGN